MPGVGANLERRYGRHLRIEQLTFEGFGAVAGSCGHVGHAELCQQIHIVELSQVLPVRISVSRKSLFLGQAAPTQAEPSPFSTRRRMASGRLGLSACSCAHRSAA